MHDSAELMAFQAALLELCYAPLSLEEMQARLSTDPVFQPYQKYVETFDLKMIDVASVLVKKWGQTQQDWLTEGA